MSEFFKVLRNGLSLENPLTVLMIGLCSTLAVSTKFEGSLFMGIAVIFVLVMSNVFISAIRGSRLTRCASRSSSWSSPRS